MRQTKHQIVYMFGDNEINGRELFTDKGQASASHKPPSSNRNIGKLRIN